MAYTLPEEKIKVPRFEEAGGFYTTPERSRLMGRIRAANTKPEVALRKVLWHIGLRYRLHTKDLPGKPDLAFKRWKVAVFIDGDFWHGHDWENQRAKIKKNAAFWLPKIERNMQRDREVNAALEGMGWRVLRVWEHEVDKNFGATVFAVLRFVQECAGTDIGALLFEE